MKFCWSEAWLLATVMAGPILFGAVEPWSAFILVMMMLSLPLFLTTRPIIGAYIVDRTLVPAMAALILIGIVQWLWPGSPLGLSQFGIHTVSRQLTLNTIVFVMALLTILVCVPRLMVQRSTAVRFIGVLFIAGVILSLQGLVQAHSGNQTIFGLRAVPPLLNPFGPYFNRNHAASFLAIAVLLGLGLFLSRLSLWEVSSQKMDLLASQVVLLVFVLIPFSAIAIIGSRATIYAMFAGGAMAFIVGLLLWVPQRRGRLIFGSLALLIALVCSYTLSRPAVSGRRVIDLQESTQYRLSMYRSGWRMLVHQPLGYGLGSFRTAFAAHKEKIVDGQVNYLHSDWGQLAVESGVIGFLIVGIGMCVFFHRLKLQMSRIKTWEDRMIFGGVLAAIFCTLLHATVEFHLHNPANALIVACLLAWLVGFQNQVEPPPSSRALENVLGGACTGRWVCGDASCDLLVVCPPL
jgi:hypothetical protein